VCDIMGVDITEFKVYCEHVPLKVDVPFSFSLTFSFSFSIIFRHVSYYTCSIVSCDIFMSLRLHFFKAPLMDELTRIIIPTSSLVHFTHF
jgi:hypothetical protein